MTIKVLLKNTKESEGDISGIKVSIQNQSKRTFMGNPTELYFGELDDIPEEYLEYEIKNKSQICASSDSKRDGAYVLEIQIKEQAETKNGANNKEQEYLTSQQKEFLVRLKSELSPEDATLIDEIIADFGKP